MSKLINVNCLHFIGCQNYTKVLIHLYITFYIKFKSLLFYHSFQAYYICSYSCQRSCYEVQWKCLKLAIVTSIIFGPLKTSEVIEKLRLRNFQGVSSFDFSTLYASLPHDLIKAKVLSLVNAVSTESQNRTSVLHLNQDFSATRNMTGIDVGLVLSYVKLLLSLGHTNLISSSSGIFAQKVGTTNEIYF